MADVDRAYLHIPLYLVMASQESINGRRIRNAALWWQIHASSTRLDRKKFHAASLFSDKNSYFSISVAMPADSPGFITQRWMRPWHRTLTGEPRVICVGSVISISTAVPFGIASGKKKYTPRELTSSVIV